LNEFNNIAAAWRAPFRAPDVPRIHKPSALVNFGLPDPLSFRVREHAMVAADRGQTSTGKASGSGCKTSLTRHLGECNVCKDSAAKVETQEIKNEPPIGLCGIDAIDGRTKPDQYGRSICRLGYGSARASSRQAFLRNGRVRELGAMEFCHHALQQDLHEAQTSKVK
jgi:hypothetical protein